MPDTTPVPTQPDASTALHDELAHERLRGMHRINLLRLWGVSAFFALFLVLGGLLQLPAWTGNLELFAVYWVITAAVSWASRRFARLAPLSCLAIALVDTPFVFLLQWSTFPTSPSASGVAGFTVGVYVLFVILATLSLETRYILLTAATGAAFEVLLQHLAGVSVGAMISTVLLLGLATLACSYARDRLVGLAGRVETAAQLEAASRRAEDRLRETMGLLDIAQTLGGVTEVNEALRRICRELARLTGAETVAAYLVDRERAELRPTAGYHVPKNMLEGLAAMRVGLADARFAPVLEKGDLLWTDNVPEDSRLRPWSDQFPHRSALAIPSIVGGRVSAVFYLVWWTRRHSFDRAELTLAQAIGEQVGTFIQNAQLYEQLDESRQRSVQVERLRALGEMAAGVAHDFNNVLAVVVGRAQLLQRPRSAPESGRLGIIEGGPGRRPDRASNPGVRADARTRGAGRSKSSTSCAKSSRPPGRAGRTMRSQRLATRCIEAAAALGGRPGRAAGDLPESTDQRAGRDAPGRPLTFSGRAWKGRVSCVVRNRRRHDS